MSLQGEGEDPYEPLRARFRCLSDDLVGWQPFELQTTVRRVPKGTLLIEVEEPVSYAYFCVKGLFRLYYTLPDGREYIAAFSTEDDFVTSYAAMVQGVPSYYAIEALEDSLVIEIPYTVLQELTAGSHKWERFVRISVERLYIRKEERERQLLFLSAKERYEAFLQKYPGLEKRIPQYYIASYIGISPVSLSRLLRAKGTGAGSGTDKGTGSEAEGR